MRMTSNWICPECGEAIPIHLDALSGIDGSRIKVRVRVPETALADAFAHAWAHREGTFDV